MEVFSLFFDAVFALNFIQCRCLAHVRKYISST